MNVWMINPYGAAPDEGWAPYRFTLAARALADRGHSVTWWTSAFSHHRKRERATPWQERTFGERMRVRFVPALPYRRNISFRRLLSESAFAFRTWRHAVRESERPDVIVAADPPQLAGFAATCLGKRFGVPVVLDCLDLWPEMFLEPIPGAVRPLARLLLLPLYALRRYDFARAAAVIYSAETYRRELEGLARDARQETIAIGVELGEPPAVRTPASAAAGLRAVYAGTLGEAYDIETLLAAAAILAKKGSDARIAFFGEGPLRGKVEEAASNPGGIVSYGGVVPAIELRSRYAQFDSGLLPYAAGSTVASPVKLFDYLAAGLPVVTSLGGEVRDLLEGAGAGAFYRAGDAAGLASLIEELAADPERRAAMGERAAALARNFDAARLYERYAEIVERAATERR